MTIVGVGASAGGLEAFSQLLGTLPSNVDLALVLVQHLAPQHESALPTLLRGKTKMPVRQVTDGMKVEAGNVYVIPPNVQMGITDGVLHLVPRPVDRTRYIPVDSFFHSLAESMQARAIGVILSGTASDGSIGIRDIKAVGGITIAQAPETAKYDGMPRAAIATGMVDLILPPEQIGAEIVKLAHHPYVKAIFPRRAEDELLVDEAQLERGFGLLRTTSGVDFRHYKVPTIKRRIQRRMALHKITSFPQYVKFLQQNRSELNHLYQDVLIHVTRFFREPESFDVLVKEVFPTVLAGRADNDPIRIWIPGCATGEEAYSVAIVLAEYLADVKKPGMPVQLFGTDVSEPAIEFARTGSYTESIAADVARERLRRFFTKTDGNYRISKTIRDSCVFARQDVTRDPPFSRLDLIVCRNVLIYMNTVLQQRLMGIFHYALKPTGFLVLGHAETIGPHAELFELADKRHRIYRRKAGGGLRPLPSEYGRTSAAAIPSPGKPDAREQQTAIYHEVDRTILHRYGPPAVLVDQGLQILQFRGQTGPYLASAPGEASLNVMRMAREGLVYALRKALDEARHRRAPVRKGGVRVRSNTQWKDVALEIVPLTQGGKMHFLIIFDEEGRASKKAPVHVERAGSKKRGGETRIAELQQELASSREYLQSIIQELEAANEELQSANEEVLSSNEELQSTNEELDTAKEELQSTNEELNTVNEELHGRNEELSRLNSDLLNLLGSVHIPIVIIGSDLRIRRFTPMAEKIMNLIPGDVGRPIGNIKPNIECPDLEERCAEVIDSMTVFERDVHDRDGRAYALRIRPYKNLENRIEGAVLTLFDVDHARHGEIRQPDTLDLLAKLVAVMREPVAVVDMEWRLRAANEAFCRAVGVEPDKTAGRLLADLGDGFDVAPLRAAVQRATPGDGATEPVRLGSKQGRSLVVRPRPLVGADGDALTLLVLEDTGAAPTTG